MDISEYIGTLYKDSKIDTFEESIINYALASEIPFLSKEKGRVLSMITRLKNPKKVLEIGLGSGYSTYIILRGINKSSKLISIDSNFFRVDAFYENIFKKLPNHLQTKLQVYPLNAFYVIEKLKEVEERFDMIFLDAGKRDYLEYLKNLVNLLNKGGVLVVDNITYLKQTFKEGDIKRSKNYLEGIKLTHQANIFMANLNNFETIFIPIGDGISISFKLQD